MFSKILGVLSTIDTIDDMIATTSYTTRLYEVEVRRRWPTSRVSGGGVDISDDVICYFHLVDRRVDNVL